MHRIVIGCYADGNSLLKIIFLGAWTLIFLTSSVADHGFDPPSGQTKTIKLVFAVSLQRK